MRETLRIPPAPDSTAFAAPLEIFDTLRPHVERYNWLVVGDLWLNGKRETQRDLLAFEEEVNAAPDGKWLSWDELHGLLSELIQVIDGTFVGFSSETPELPQDGLAGGERRFGQHLLVGHGRVRRDPSPRTCPAARRARQ